MAIEKDEIYELGWDIFQSIREMWSESTKEADKESIHSEILKKRWDLYQKLEQIPGKSDNITYYDTSDLFYEIEARTNIPYDKITNDEFKKYLDDYLLGKPFDYEFCFRITKKPVFSSGYELGSGKVFPFDDLPKTLRKYVEQSMYMEFLHDHEYHNTKEEYIEYRKKNDNYLYLTVKALYHQSATNKAISQSNRSLNILKFINAFKRFSIYGDDSYSHFNYYFNCNSLKTSGSRGGASFEGLPVHRWVILDNQVNAITEMMLKDKKTDLEKRILNVIDVYGLIDDSTPLHLSFILCVIALEGLLLHDGEKDYLGWKLAEKLSFLLGDSVPWLITAFQIKRDQITPEVISSKTFEGRKLMSEKVTQLYNKRSRFAHSGIDPKKDKDRIIAQDYEFTFLILRWSVDKLIELRKNGVENIAVTAAKDGKSLDEYIQKLKLG